eukprot:UN04087
MWIMKNYLYGLLFVIYVSLFSGYLYYFIQLDILVKIIFGVVYNMQLYVLEYDCHRFDR